MPSDPLRVSVVGYHHARPVEGIRVVTQEIVRIWSRYAEVFTVSLLSPSTWTVLTRRVPTITHLVLGPSSHLGMALAGVVSAAPRESYTILSVLQPTVKVRSGFVRILGPDLTLVQSSSSMQMFDHLGCRTAFLPNGVDLVRFTPGDEEGKKRLREAYGVPQKALVALHIGSLEPLRNLGVMKEARKHGFVGVIAARRIVGSRKVEKNYIDSGCVLIEGIVENIADLYRMADVYVFPTTSLKSCIETPLTVLEALACNVPVVATRFGGLPEMFGLNGIPGVLEFVENSDSIWPRAHKLLRDGNAQTPREAVAEFSWDAIAARLTELTASEFGIEARR